MTSAILRLVEVVDDDLELLGEVLRRVDHLREGIDHRLEVRLEELGLLFDFLEHLDLRLHVRFPLGHREDLYPRDPLSEKTHLPVGEPDHLLYVDRRPDLIHPLRTGLALVGVDLREGPDHPFFGEGLVGELQELRIVEKKGHLH